MGILAHITHDMRLTSPEGAFSLLAGFLARTGPAGWGLLTEPGGYLSQNIPSRTIGFLSTKPHIQPSNRLVKVSVFILWPVSRIPTAGQPLHLF